MKTYYRLEIDYKTVEGLKEQQEYMWSKKAENAPINRVSEIYLENKEDVIKFLRRLIYVNGIEWTGEEGIQIRIERDLKNIDQMLDDVGIKYTGFGVDGRAVTIYKICIDNIDILMDSPLLNKRLT